MPMKKGSSAYAEKLKDPRWQKKRLQIMERDGFTCQICFDSESMLVVHHRYYIWKKEPWDYDNDLLVTLCQACHEAEHDEQDPASDLLKMLKWRGFFNHSISGLTTAIHAMPMVYPPDVIASAIVHLMGSEERMKDFMARYFADLAEMDKAKKSAEGEQANG